MDKWKEELKRLSREEREFARAQSNPKNFRSVGIKPGDTVIHKVTISDGRIVRNERIAYTVKHVYPYFLVVERPKGYTESLNFWRYLCGEVEIA